MKKWFTTVLTVIFMLSSVSIVSAAEESGDGFRSQIKQSNFSETVVGGQTKLKIPSSANINAIAGQIYPEFFISINSKQGATFDGGVILDGTQWKAVIFGGASSSTWQETNISNITGQTVNLKLAGEKDSRGEYIVKLTVSNSSGSTIGSISVDKNTPKYYKGNRDGELGWLAENPYYSGLNTVSYELNMVPTSSISAGYYHKTTGSNGKRAFFDGAEMSIAVPIKKAGGTLALNGFSWSHTKNCDDFQYTQADVDKLVYDVSNQTYLYTTMNFNNLP
ncbi:hypothetical protein MH117_17995 [Paenibacillus sp. ACRRX]|uniref:hypothetical protein n=1 Tax=Paenibacillus sp. ACRRX TaxID=2918206 RepID=UPI001EF3EA49|nr:hypothetical protein [Paenibacillus sp. ACRRX]MCG7409313.1 hypothetical protein [Paenibacillus sp. ACRRX]